MNMKLILPVARTGLDKRLSSRPGTRCLVSVSENGKTIVNKWQLQG